jgi:hypothetical protein
MHILFHSACLGGRKAARVLVFCCLFLLSAAGLTAQSTFGVILGTVRDSSGALVTGAHVTLINSGTAARRTVDTDASGNYAFRNIDAQHYTLSIEAPGFQKQSTPEVVLTARETRRLDVNLRLGNDSQTVVVLDDSLPVINTEVSSLAETKVGEELVDLPVAIYSRSTGSTSPISTLTTEAGVQTDDSGSLAVMGTTAALLSVTIDGISSVGVEYSGPINEMFPSFNSIEEIRVSESNNSAEFSGVADITTVSKAGTTHFHGGLFENHENSALNSGQPLAFANSKPRLIMNDFGGTLGGPLSFPHLNLGQSFFFASYEGLRLPRETPMTLSVPSLAMRGGNLTNYLGQQGVSAIYNIDGSPVADTSNVAVNPVSAQLLTALFPTPNYGSADSFSNNYQANMRTPISTNQGDIRLDRTISSRQTVFARFSYKNRQVVTAPSSNCVLSYCAEAGSPLLGGFNTPEIDEGLTLAHNYIFSTALMNEFRGGFNEQHSSETQNFSTASLLSQTGLLGVTPQPDLLWSEAPQVLITGFLSTGAGNPGMQRSQIIQLLDNLTWTRQNHTFKFGVDFKRLYDHDENLFGNYRSGWYVFNNTAQIVPQADGDSNITYTSIGDPYAAFLEGYPDYTEVSSTNRSTMDGHGYSWAGFAQDDWKLTPRLTLNLGLRYEFHPPIHDSAFNMATFDADYTGTNDGQAVRGAVVAPNAQALQYESAAFKKAIAPTPILTAAQAGLPENLRYTDKTDWGPRLGFAWRPLGNDKTVVRGGWGRFIESPLGFSLYAGFGVFSSYQATYNQAPDLKTGAPLLSFANPFNNSAAGTADFDYSFPIHYKDPTVQQWNLTFEQDLGKNMGLRLSYTGSAGRNMEAMVDLNQVHPNSTGYDASLVPFSSFSIIQSVVNAAFANYNSGTVELSRHNGKGLTFDASYTFTRDLSNAGGATPTAFAVAGGSFLTDRFNPGLDYGNVIYDRKHRLLATWLYELPFGEGKAWLNHKGFADLLAGGWQLGGVGILQSGPFLTPYESSTDPAGTNILTTETITRADLDKSKRIYPAVRNASQWLESPNNAGSAFSVPANNRGYFGTAGVGSVVGPGTVNLSLSLMKNFNLSDQAHFQFGLEAANVFNHRNYEPPNMQVDAPNSFGVITALQTAEGAGPRSLQLSGRFTF